MFEPFYKRVQNYALPSLKKSKSCFSTKKKLKEIKEEGLKFHSVQTKRFLQDQRLNLILDSFSFKKENSEIQKMDLTDSIKKSYTFYFKTSKKELDIILFSDAQIKNLLDGRKSE